MSPEVQPGAGSLAELANHPESGPEAHPSSDDPDYHEADDRDRYYREAWDAGTRAVLANVGALSHHHGVGLNRSRFVAEAL